MKRPKTLALVLAAALVTTAATIALLVERPEGSREVGSGARGGGRDLVSPDRPANRAVAPKPGRTFGPNRARRRRQQRNLNETARALASELRLPEQRVKRALIDVRRRRFEARLEERIEKIRRSERRARRTPRRAR